MRSVAGLAVWRYGGAHLRPPHSHARLHPARVCVHLRPTYLLLPYRSSPRLRSPRWVWRHAFAVACLLCIGSMPRPDEWERPGRWVGSRRCALLAV